MFCGKRPTDKNREHVVPRWLLEMTGSSRRLATFAPVWNDRTKELDVLRIPFSKFVFPAYTDCNERFSELEGSAKQVMEKMLGHEEISAADLSVMLSWLDKVRTGLWLAFYFLQRNYWTIDPHMAIADRVDRADRLVFLYRATETREGVWSYPGFADSVALDIRDVPASTGLRSSSILSLSVSERAGGHTLLLAARYAV